MAAVATVNWKSARLTAQQDREHAHWVYYLRINDRDCGRRWYTHRLRHCPEFEYHKSAVARVLRLLIVAGNACNETDDPMSSAPA
jgi:hypothetical protein